MSMSKRTGQHRAITLLITLLVYQKEGDIPLFGYLNLIYHFLLIKEVSNPLNPNFKYKHVLIKKVPDLMLLLI